VGEPRDIKFGVSVDHSKPSLRMTNCPRMVHGHVT